MPSQSLDDDGAAGGGEVSGARAAAAATSDDDPPSRPPSHAPWMYPSDIRHVPFYRFSLIAIRKTILQILLIITCYYNHSGDMMIVNSGVSFTFWRPIRSVLQAKRQTN